MGVEPVETNSRLNTTVSLILLTSILVEGFAILPFAYIKPGVYLDFVFYNLGDRGYVDETLLLKSSSDIVFCLMAEIITPEAPVPLGSGCFKGVPTLYIPYDRLEPFIKEWVRLLESRMVRKDGIKSHVIGLLIHGSVINTTSRSLLYSIIDSIPVELGDLIEARAVGYTLYARRGVYQLAYSKNVIRAFTTSIELPQGRLVESAQGGFDYCSPAYQGWAVCYRRIAEIKPEDLQQYLPADYFMSVNSTLYMKTPILVAWNPYTYSGEVNAYIVIGVQNAKAEVRLAFASGEILSKIRNASLPSVNLQLGSATWGGEWYRFTAPIYLLPNEAGWIYIWARPLQRYWQVYVCLYNECVYDHDEVESFITDILVSGREIKGGSMNGLPHQIIMNNFYNSTNSTRLIVPGTSLADGKLDVNESFALGNMFQYYDTCGSGFEVGTSMAPIAAAVCAMLGLPTGGAACAAAVAFASAFQVSLDLEGGSIYVDGGFANCGNHTGRGYNVPEYVYTRVSIYQYETPPPWWCPTCSPCKYTVPAGLYFEFW
ncbi:hypothetical protein ACSU1N_00750 [Thermogladius sp. 4427co]|uniref:hypothetical protein n=1 Tax=Thermogladius sp. 4427co TaxID=3450718 RepID=UPI003F79C0D2